MNYTENYHLPQWVKEDRIMMDDFNQMCADIESGLAGNRAAAQQGDAALSERITAAQNTADTARAEVAALYVTGTYEGKTASIFIDIGFRPTAIIISKFYAEVYDPGGEDLLKTAASLFLDGGGSPGIEFRDEGFRVWPDGSNTHLINKNGKKFFFIAFR